MSRILCVSADKSLLLTRTAVLETVGAACEPATASDAPPILAHQRFDLVVLCHTVPYRDTLAILEQLDRTSPPTPVLLLSTSLDENSQLPLEAEYPVIHTMELTGDPAALVQTVRHYLATYAG